MMTYLSKRENEVWNLIKQKMTYQQVADILFISKRTVDKHMENIRRKNAEVFKEVY